MQNFNLQFASLAFFALNGLFFASFILIKSINEENAEGKWLSSFVFLCSLYVCPYMFGYMNWYALDGYREFLFYVPFQQLFLLGPIFYGYILNVLEPNRLHFQGKSLFHFLPAFLYAAYSLVSYIGDAWILEKAFFYADGRDKDLLPWYQFTGLLSMIYYFMVSLKSYKKYQNRIVQELSYADSVIYKWVQLFLICLILILTARIIFIVLFPNFGSFRLKYWYYLVFSILIYFLTLKGYTHLITTINLNYLQKNAARTFLDNAENNHLVEAKPFQKPLSEGQLSQHKIDLGFTFEQERLFENPQLSLQDVAAKMEWSLRETSQIINQGFGKNFNDFVNAYRVDAVKEKLAKGEQAHHTLLAIALDCGFNSKSTFNRVFKRITEQTPLEYLNSIK
jgi:AraC-like DNA-binding protein